jgi:hypothetical protein
VLRESSLDEYEVVMPLILEGILTLFSATYHELTTVIPSSIEITLPASMRTPALLAYPAVAVYKSLYHAVSVETVKRRGYVLKVYDRERTLCEFFRMRLRIGKDAALDVLKLYMAGKKNLQRLYECTRHLQNKESPGTLCRGFPVNKAESVKARLKNIAVAENKSFNFILMHYFIEHLLYRPFGLGV